MAPDLTSPPDRCLVACTRQPVFDIDINIHRRDASLSSAMASIRSYRRYSTLSISIISTRYTGAVEACSIVSLSRDAMH